MADEKGKKDGAKPQDKSLKGSLPFLKKPFTPDYSTITERTKRESKNEQGERSGEAVTRKKDSAKPEEKSPEDPFLKKPSIPDYCSIPEGTIERESETTLGEQDGETAIPGFAEFRKYKRINETRIITPYMPEPPKDEKIVSDVKKFPKVEIETDDRFLLEKIRSIPVQSLEDLLQLISTYPDVGYVTMNRPHMDLINDYQPYKYVICNCGDKEKTNYVTISPNGLMEFYKSDADFMELDRLLTEFELYRTLREIPLFSFLYYWKAFMVWFKKIRKRKFEDAKANIEAFFAEKYKLKKKIKVLSKQ